jgi:hypothetical protein
MLVMNGEECLTQLRSISADVPVLLSSGFSETEAASLWLVLQWVLRCPKSGHYPFHDLRD